MQSQERKNNRISTYDYGTPNCYSVTICTYQKKKLFGEIIVGKLVNSLKLSEFGVTVQQEIKQVEEVFAGTTIENFVVMPNHLHILITITDEASCNLSNIVAYIKSKATKRLAKEFNYREKVWQGSFYDHIVTSQTDYLNEWQYIQNNPQNWQSDRFYDSRD